ncbi:Na+/H+ antiporter NhaC family protein [Riemerella anatipestifer]|uniref:Na+/H+ antiporter NhaC family protein n=1 Tax=Riemerella anatipestifer TaxID=34085 RepID=UPI0013737701|nr:Na+/H+ antiporter NhaC family protein [Riemerella anatipestifer]MBT0548929.1 Na+/H+ antiporter NhaC family protein [Riemerella anatipestifer]MBT0555243.1 Na+/H+ antiporter NhaC family protein [Riemerella anatipestifer]MBT0559692.1 Na+/H+ antiporter NhaC family protein [Riemerella anatipestifer]NAV15489.1 Na+/H+ antiporter NhaC family protein [Riemerella anatipestifer]UZX28805.1 Na+/H+ antiporter NhaC family protein [Riemerella anatipestifer]
MKKTSIISVIPLLVFVSIFIGSGIYFNDFYVLPSPIAVMVGIISAFLLFKGKLSEKIDTFLNGCGDHKILNMCIIYLLAGAFAVVSKSIGSVDIIVNLGVNIIPFSYIPVGVFIIASFISISSGTSVGTIVALGSVVVGFADKGIDINLLGAALLGGAMLGDNLSVISDTTIAATQTLECEMKDKFRTNLKIALPAAIVTCILYVVLANTNAPASNITSSSSPTNTYQLFLILPYLLVILLSLMGINVFLVLLLGIVFSSSLGFFILDFGVLEISKKVYEGFTSMQEIFILSLFTGGLAALVEKAGGMEFLLNRIKKIISGRKSALLGAGTLVSLVDIATANNTIAIIISGKIAKNISTHYKIAPRFMASVLDIFSCVIQGLLPYGAQILIIIGLSNNRIDYFNLVSYTFYPILLLLCVLLWIFFSKEEKKAQI